MKMKDYEIESLNYFNYSFTFCIPPFKNVYYKCKFLPYKLLSQEQQYDFLETHLQNIKKPSQIKWIYEEHEDKRLHIHGMCLNTMEEDMENFRIEFYKYPIQMTYKSSLKVSDIQRTKCNIVHFVNYMNKHQHEIKYFMQSDEEYRRNQAMNDEKLDFKEPKFIIAPYLNSLEEHLESEYLGDEYNFGKPKKEYKNKKYIVEF